MVSYFKSNPIQSGKIFIGVGGLILLLGVWGLYRDIRWIAQPFYAYAWWGYILILDGFVAIRRKSSILTTRSHHFLPLFFWSVTFWFFFELLNLRYQNWYYVGVFHSYWLSFGFGIFCFATVFIGMFETYEALTALFRPKQPPYLDRRFPTWVSYAVQFLGLFMVSLSLFFPTYLAPLVWGSVTFLVDPWNYRRQARSLLRDFECGNYSFVIRLLAAGLICGGFWESMNFFAPQKWIYTVRGLENFKLFEMPLLGFLGFPALALDAMAVYSLLAQTFLGNETWENPEDRYEQLPCPIPASSLSFHLSIPFQLFFCALILIGVRTTNTASYEFQIQDLSSLPQSSIQSLHAMGVTRPRQILRLANDPQSRAALMDQLKLSEQDLQTLLNEIELQTFKGIGRAHARLLNAAGITRVDQLAQQDPEYLHRTLFDLSEEERIKPPRLDIVRVWIFAAQSRGIVLKVR